MAKNEWYEFYLRTGGLLSPIPLEDPFIKEIIRRENIREGKPEGSPLTDGRIRHWAYRFDEERNRWGSSFEKVMPLIEEKEKDPEYNCCPPPNMFHVVEKIANQMGYPAEDRSVDVNDFTQKVAEVLHEEDSHWGRRRNDSGPLGKDTVAYKVKDSINPYSVDIVAGATSDDPEIHWDQHGQAGGTWEKP